eukprot:c21175_g1_i1 orf=1027-1212(+)
MLKFKIQLVVLCEITILQLYRKWIQRNVAMLGSAFPVLNHHICSHLSLTCCFPIDFHFSEE